MEVARGEVNAKEYVTPRGGTCHSGRESSSVLVGMSGYTLCLCVATQLW